MPSFETALAFSHTPFSADLSPTSTFRLPMPVAPVCASSAYPRCDVLDRRAFERIKSLLSHLSGLGLCQSAVDLMPLR